MNHESQPLKIVYFDEAVAYGGSLQVLSTLFGALDRNQICPTLITYLPSQQLKAKFEAHDIGLTLQPTLNYVDRGKWLSHFHRKTAFVHKIAAYAFTIAASLNGIPNQWRLFIYLLTHRPAAIHVNNSFVPLLTARLLRIPVIWHLHGNPTRASPWQNILLRGVLHFIAISKHVATEARAAGYPQSNLTVILNPAPAYEGKPAHDKRNLCHTFSIPPDHKLIAHVGRLVRWKGQLEFLKAFALLLPKYPNATALIIGGDSENFGSNYTTELKDFVASKQLQDNVKFTGPIDNVLDVMANVDLVVHSSIEPEPFGLIIIESMCVGTAVIAADIGAPPEIIDNGISGLLVSPTDEKQFSSALLQLISDDELRNRIAAAGKSSADAKYSREAFAHHVISVYRHALSGSSRFA